MKIHILTAIHNKKQNNDLTESMNHYCKQIKIPLVIRDCLVASSPYGCDLSGFLAKEGAILHGYNNSQRSNSHCHPAHNHLAAASNKRKFKNKDAVLLQQTKQKEESAYNPPYKTSTAGQVIVALDMAGELITSEEFAIFLQKAMNNGEKSIFFLIGGATGLAPNCIEQADRIFSFGRITLPHRLAKLILIEQLYRAFSIIDNKAYH